MPRQNTGASDGMGPAAGATVAEDGGALGTAAGDMGFAAISSAGFSLTATGRLVSCAQPITINVAARTAVTASW
jgi:hypothetical protein